MAKATRGFEVHIKGERVHFAEGDDVPKEVCDEFCVADKKLVSGSKKKPVKDK